MKVKEIMEGTWALPMTQTAVDVLASVFKKPLTAEQAMQRISPVLGDDELYDELSSAEDSEVDDVRPIIKKHLKRLVSGMNSWRNKPPPEVIEELEFLIDIK